MDSSELELLENQIIGSFIVDSDTHRYIKELDENIFTLPKSKVLFNTIKKLYLNKEDINLITINNKLSSGINSKGNRIIEEICNITDSIVTTSNIESSINKIKEIKLRKDMLNIVSKAIKNVQDANQDILEVKNQLLKDVANIKDNRNIKTGSTIADIFSETLDELEQKINKEEDKSLYTGFFDLDTLMDGLHGGELTAIGARPGTGKTAFALQIACNIANKKKKVYFNSLEMSSIQLMQRIISKYTGINSQFLRNGRIDKEREMLKIAENTNKITNMSLTIDTQSRYIEEIENTVCLLKDRNEIDVLFIDYLTLLKTKTNYQLRELEVAEISRRLKLLSLDLDIPIVILVQLNRDAENKVPTMANIRESGSIEQNCDNIIFLYDENAEEKNAVTNISVILEKQRQGATGIIKLKFDKKTSRFINTER